MANRIQTPSKVTDLFGPGKHGFGDDPNPMLATAFDASWCNGIQEENIRIIEWGNANGIGVPPNGAIFDQVLTVLKSFPFDGAVSIANGGTFTFKNSSTLLIEFGSIVDMRGALAVANAAVVAMLSGSTLDVQSGAMIDLKSGATFTAEDGSTVDLQTDVTLAAGKSINGALSSTVNAGTIDTIDETGVVNAGGVNFYTDATPGATNGLVQWNGKRLTVGSEGAAVVIRSPLFDYVSTASTAAASTDIAGLNISATVAPTQDVYITLEAHQSVDAINGSLLRIRATNGVDSVSQLKLGQDDAAVSDLPNQAVANERRPNSVRVRWRPTDDFPVPDNDNWTFFAQHGVSGGDTLKTTAATMMLQFL